MKTYIKMKRKSEKLLSDIEVLQEYFTLIKDSISKKIVEIDNNENFKILTNRITYQPQLNYEEFTDTEKRILELLAHGLCETEIAEVLYISPLTVKTHINNMYLKTGISNPKASSKVAKRVRLILFYLKEMGNLDYDWAIKS